MFTFTMVVLAFVAGLFTRAYWPQEQAAIEAEADKVVKDLKDRL